MTHALTATDRTLARLVSELNGPLRCSLSALSIASSVVAAHRDELSVRADEALALLCAEVEWHQTLWMHLLESLDRVAHQRQPVPLPARPSSPAL